MTSASLRFKPTGAVAASTDSLPLSPMHSVLPQLVVDVALTAFSNVVTTAPRIAPTLQTVFFGAAGFVSEHLGFTALSSSSTETFPHCTYVEKSVSEPLVFPLDCNGDGLTDLAVSCHDAQRQRTTFLLYKRIAEPGDGFPPFEMQTFSESSSMDVAIKAIAMTDLNQDGLTDFVLQFIRSGGPRIGCM